jgi:hypothetical protein
LIGHFSPIVPPFADKDFSRRLRWSASGDKRRTKNGVSTISLGRLQCIRRASAGPTGRRRSRRRRKEKEEFVVVVDDNDL